VTNLQHFFDRVEANFDEFWDWRKLVMLSSSNVLKVSSALREILERDLELDLHV
jgi:hypothetical protein